MDLLATLVTELGMDQGKAEGLAGSVLALVKNQVAASVGAADAQRFAERVPELDRWTAQAVNLPGSTVGSSGFGAGLPGAAGAASAAVSAFGGDAAGADLGSLASLGGKFGLDLGSTRKLLPIVVQFLKSKLDDELLAKVLAAVPLLGTKAAGGLGSALGGLFR